MMMTMMIGETHNLIYSYTSNTFQSLHIWKFFRHHICILYNNIWTIFHDEYNIFYRTSEDLHNQISHIYDLYNRKVLLDHSGCYIYQCDKINVLVLLLRHCFYHTLCKELKSTLIRGYIFLERDNDHLADILGHVQRFYLIYL